MNCEFCGNSVGITHHCKGKEQAMWNRAKKVFAIGAIALVAIMAVMAVAQANHVSQAELILCDTLPQIENVVEIRMAGRTTEEAIVIINEAEKNDKACLLREVFMTNIKEIKTMPGKLDGNTVVLVSLIVVALKKPQGVVPVPPLKQFSAKMVKPIGVDA